MLMKSLLRATRRISGNIYIFLKLIFQHFIHVLKFSFTVIAHCSLFPKKFISCLFVIVTLRCSALQLRLEHHLKDSRGASSGSCDRKTNWPRVHRRVYISAFQEHENHPDKNTGSAGRLGPHKVDVTFFHRSKNRHNLGFKRGGNVYLNFFFYVCFPLLFFFHYSCRKVSKTWKKIICEDSAALRRCRQAEQALRVRKLTTKLYGNLHTMLRKKAFLSIKQLTRKCNVFVHNLHLHIRSTHNCNRECTDYSLFHVITMWKVQFILISIIKIMCNHTSFRTKTIEKILQCVIWFWCKSNFKAVLGYETIFPGLNILQSSKLYSENVKQASKIWFCIKMTGPPCNVSITETARRLVVTQRSRV